MSSLTRRDRSSAPISADMPSHEEIELLARHKQGQDVAAQTSPAAANTSTDTEESSTKKTATTSPTVREELPTILLLIALYCLQGVPLGLCFGSIPFLLQSSNLSYTQLGYFTFATWPYSLKLFWSPIVDCYYSNSFGRRKSWIIPTQIVIGLMLMMLSYFVQEWISTGDMFSMTSWFFMLIVCVATQDIAVDGWAVTLLSPANVGWASTAQSIGQNLGFFASYTVFLALNNADFCNRFRAVPLEVGFFDLPSYMHFWGVVYLICTVTLAVLKKEDAYTPEKGEELDIVPLYGRMWRIIQLPPMRTLILIFLTTRIAFSCADNLTALKLIEKGFSKEKMAILVFFLFPFELFWPILVGSWATKSGNSMIPFIQSYPFRLITTLIGVAVVYNYPTGIDINELSTYFYVQIFFLQLLYSFASNVMFVAQCSFFAQICDDRIGATYMTLVNTITNLGGAWHKSLIFVAVDKLTCKLGATDCQYLTPGTDGFYILSFVCFFIGVIWWLIFRSKVVRMGQLDKKVWSCD